MALHITLRQLEIFCATVATGSAVGAGQNLGLSQSAISSALKELEQQLDVQLFERIGKRLICNEQGKSFYTRALAVLEQTKELQQLFTGESGDLHIATSTTIGNYILPPILAQLQKTHPQLKLQITISNSNDIIEQIAQLKCGLGLIESTCHHPDIVTEIWQYDELMWFCAKPTQWFTPQPNTTPIALNEILRRPLVMREVGSGSRELLENKLEQQGLQLYDQSPHITELSNSEAIKQAVRHDLGIGCLSRHVLAEFLELGYLQTISTPEPNIIRPLFIIQHRQKSPNHLTDLLKKYLLANQSLNKIPQ